MSADKVELQDSPSSTQGRGPEEVDSDYAFPYETERE